MCGFLHKWTKRMHNINCIPPKTVLPYDQPVTLLAHGTYFSLLHCFVTNAILGPSFNFLWRTAFNLFTLHTHTHTSAWLKFVANYARGQTIYYRQAQAVTDFLCCLGNNHNNCFNYLPRSNLVSKLKNAHNIVFEQEFVTPNNRGTCFCRSYKIWCSWAQLDQFLFWQWSSTSPATDWSWKFFVSSGEECKTNGGKVSQFFLWFVKEKVRA